MQYWRCLAIFTRKKILIGTLIVGCVLSAQAATITQTAGQSTGASDWNGADWGSPAAAPAAGNAYVTNAALGGSTDATFGVNTTSYLRIFDTGTGSTNNVFGGDSIEVVSGERLLDKALTGDGATANFILDGGSLIDVAANAPGTTSLNGILQVTAGIATVGVNQAAAATLNINAALSGTGTLDLAGTNGLGVSTIILNGNINGFSGTVATVTNGTYGITTSANAPAGKLNLASGTFDLSNNLVLGGLTVAGVAFGSGTYTAAQINTISATSQVVDTSGTGADTITVVPEPSTWAMTFGGLLLGLQGYRRGRSRLPLWPPSRGVSRRA